MLLTLCFDFPLSIDDSLLFDDVVMCFILCVVLYSDVVLCAVCRYSPLTLEERIQSMEKQSKSPKGLGQGVRKEHHVD